MTHTWQKSSYSTQGANCLTIAAAPNGKLQLRESDNPDTILTLTATQLRTLIRMLKGEIR
ncbi:DUF397 domain-containing protein [Streptomyces olivoreticuli]|uniref:DUF397 domain-containing protein n=1 Tax=Streptomyces olivoreticuli TaxID=68246 RepID=UPI000E25AEF9|nr:DUF397 domain-containing protein [Streptomyces olivoreticuli]